MNIIKLSATDDGFRPPIQSWIGQVPDGYIEVPESVDTSAMQTHMGFVDLTVDEDGVLTAITGNEAAYKAYLDSLPPKIEPGPTEAQLLGQEITELQLEQIAQGQMMTDLQLTQLEGGKANV